MRFVQPAPKEIVSSTTTYTKILFLTIHDPIAEEKQTPIVYMNAMSDERLPKEGCKYKHNRVR